MERPVLLLHCDMALWNLFVASWAAVVVAVVAGVLAPFAGASAASSAIALNYQWKAWPIAAPSPAESLCVVKVVDNAETSGVESAECSGVSAECGKVAIPAAVVGPCWKWDPALGDVGAWIT